MPAAWRDLRLHCAAKLNKAIHNWLLQPRAVWALVVAALVLAAPALNVGFAFDDYVHRHTLLGYEPLPGIPSSGWDLFAFLKDDPAALRAGREYGVFPWWTPDTLRLAFLRPVSSLTHLLDYALWPNQPVLMHAQSLAWFGVLVFLVFKLYRAAASTPAAAFLATLFFAVDDAHATVVSWLANRNALVAGVFGTLSLIFHLRWRGARKFRDLALSLLMFAIALFSGEMALGFFGYVLAYALACEQDKLSERLRGVLPCALVIVLWSVIYRVLGYGATDSWLYIDPAREPLKFAGVFVARAPVLLWSQFLPPPADFFTLVPNFVRLAWAALGVVVLLLVLWRARGFLRDNRRARFWALGALFAVVPVCSTFPSDRLLLVVGIGAMGFAAEALTPLVFPGDAPAKPPQSPGLGRRAAIFAFILLHGVLAPLALSYRAFSLRTLANVSARARDTVPSGSENRTLVVVNSPEPLLCSQIVAWRAGSNLPVPKRIHCLGASEGKVEVTRSDARTLALRADGYFQTVFAGLFGMPDTAQSVFSVRGLDVEITETTPEGRPIAVRVRFEHALEAGEYLWAEFAEQGLKRFVPPKIGETRTLFGPSMMKMMTN